MPPGTKPSLHHLTGSYLPFGIGFSISVLGGLIGLGGAEFRLPALVGVFGYTVRRAIPLNLSVSLVTLAASLAVRSRTLSLVPLVPYTAAIAGLVLGSLGGALAGPRVAQRLSSESLKRLILGLLVAIGALLVAEAFLPVAVRVPIPRERVVWAGVGAALGFGIGLVSSLLGVAGGELLIPTLVFGYGADVKTAGTASVLIALPTVVAGLVRWGHVGGFDDRTGVREIVLPMAVGSVLGAFAGAVAARFAPAEILKAVLGAVLILSALRTLRSPHDRGGSGPPAAR